tara:strand:- start:850 stop:1251 length:402 start_codon:yes stop_codon:yes gene_type:complete
MDEHLQNAARTTKLRRFQIVSVPIGAGILLSAFLPDRYTVTAFFPAYLGAALAFYLWNFTRISENARSAFIVVFFLFFVRESAHIGQSIETRVRWNDIQAVCLRPQAMSSQACREIDEMIHNYLNPEAADSDW